MNCSPLVETMDTRLLSSEELSLFIAAEAVAARPIFELAMASSNDDGGSKKTTSPAFGGNMDRVTSTTLHTIT